MHIGPIDLDRKILIVAEIGNNHEGNFKVAGELVRRAAESGADAVKFQTFRTEGFVGRSDEARFKRLKGFELTYPQFEELSRLAKSLGLLFISTPLDPGSIDFLAGIVDALKLASGDNNVYPMIDRMARRGKPLIISTGLSDAAQVDRTVDCVRRAVAPASVQDRLAVLHCVTAYPVPADQANLRSIPFLAERLKLTVGYSDHTLGIEACLLAVALGARILEKHFTLDKNYSDFRDHKISADPADLRELVRRTREAGPMLGAYAKDVQAVETPAMPLIRRSISAARDLPAGHVMGASDLGWTRPSGGFAPGEEDRVVGRRLRRALGQGEMINASDVD